MINIKSLFTTLEYSHVSHTERIISALGGLIAILCIFAISQQILKDAEINHILIASMGASAVLIFAVPHGALSQPWSVFAGHITSALIGVTCAQWLPHLWIAASIAVGLSIIVMYYLNCIHPPGGATALAAVIGSDSVQQLGYQFVLTPILLNVVLIILLGIVFNYPFYWRRYPTALYRSRTHHPIKDSENAPVTISHADFVYALNQIDSFIDVNEQDLLHIYNIAVQKSKETYTMFKDIKVGEYYSNGKYGKNWAIYQVIDKSPHDNDAEQDIIHFKIVVGVGRRTLGKMTQQEFMQWAQYRVVRDEENWKKMEMN